MSVNPYYTQKVRGFQQETVKYSQNSVVFALRRTLHQCPRCGSTAVVATPIRKAADIVLSAGRRFGLSLGVVTPEGGRHWLDLGVNMLSTGNDYSFVLAGARQNLELLRAGK